MAIVEIPVQITGTEGQIRSTFVLEQRQWTFIFRKNSVDDSWFWSLVDDANEAIINGEPLALGASLLDKFSAIDVPLGQLFVVEQGDGTGGRDPRVDDFKDGLASLYYNESA